MDPASVEGDAAECGEKRGPASYEFEDPSPDFDENLERPPPDEWRRQLVREVRVGLARMSPRAFAHIARRESRSLARRWPPSRVLRRICTGARFRRRPRPRRRPSASRSRARAAPDPDPNGQRDRWRGQLLGDAGIRDKQRSAHGLELILRRARIPSALGDLRLSFHGGDG